MKELFIASAITVIFCIIMVIYFLPVIIAYARVTCRHRPLIVILAVVLGWTIIGWVAALILAIRRARYEYEIRGFKVAVFTGKGWQYLKRQPMRDNPVSILRDLLIRSGKYPMETRERAFWDNILGDLYRYAEGKIDGFVIENKGNVLGFSWQPSPQDDFIID